MLQCLNTVTVNEWLTLLAEDDRGKGESRSRSIHRDVTTVEAKRDRRRNQEAKISRREVNKRGGSGRGLLMMPINNPSRSKDVMQFLYTREQLTTISPSTPFPSSLNRLMALLFRRLNCPASSVSCRSPQTTERYPVEKVLEDVEKAQPQPLSGAEMHGFPWPVTRPR